MDIESERRDLEKSLRSLQLSVVRRTDRKEPIGVGSYSNVYEVIVHKTVCAAKATTLYEISETEKSSFLRGCVQSSRIVHPNVVQFIGIFYPSPVNQSLPWLVMELMHISLTSLIKKYEKCDFSIVFKLCILINICEGLQFLHSLNIIHRNLSSNNVLLTKHLVAKITDLNITKIIPSGLEGQKQIQATSTEVFMPSEVLENYEIHSTAVDVFSVGCVCLHVISMQWPEPLAKQGNSQVDMSEVQMRARYFTNFKDNPSLKLVVEKCLHDNYEHRPVIEEVCKSLKDIDHSHRTSENYFTDIVDLCRAHEHKLAEYETLLIHKDKQLNEKDMELYNRNQELDQKILLLDKKDQQLDQKEQQLIQRDQEILRKDKILKENEQRLMYVDQCLKQKDEVIIEKDRELTQKDVMLKQKNKTSKQKDEKNVMVKCNSQLAEDHPTMKQLLEVMRTQHITTAWYELGLELLDNDIPLEEIKANNHDDVKDCCTKMFKKWLDTQPNASWTQLVSALNKIGLCTTADAVITQYIPGYLKKASEIVCASLLDLCKLSDEIKKGTATGKIVENYRNQAKELQALKEPVIIGSTPLVSNFVEVDNTIKICVEKLAKVKEYRSKLVVLVDYCKRISQDLTQVISQEVNENSNVKLADKQISEICKVEDDGSYNYICFSTSEVCDEMINNFSICGKCNEDFNKVFEYCWDHQIKMSTITAVQDISYNCVYEEVWKPTIKQCQSLLIKLKDKTVTLEEVEILYQFDNLSLHLSVLCKAMHQCYPNLTESLPLPDKWISQTLSHIELYYKIANNPKCIKAANVILEVKKSLMLEGNFKLVEDLAKLVCVYDCTHEHICACSHTMYVVHKRAYTNEIHVPILVVL